MIRLLVRLQKEKNISMLFICHDLALIRSFAHQIAVMYLGNIVEVIPGEDVTEKSLHPYTQALLGAQFSIHMDQNKKIESIESEAPALWMFLMAVHSRIVANTAWRNAGRSVLCSQK